MAAIPIFIIGAETLLLYDFTINNAFSYKKLKIQTRCHTILNVFKNTVLLFVLVLISCASKTKR